MDYRLIIVCIFMSAYAQRWEGKPGRCPSSYNKRRCVCNPQRHGCHSDYDCPGSQKCCDLGCTCGPSCTYPVMETDVYPHQQGNSDYVCFLPKAPQSGPFCYGYFPRWWYNWRTKQCERFIYGGCRGNENNFQTRQKCERRCKRKHN